MDNNSIKEAVNLFIGKNAHIVEIRLQLVLKKSLTKYIALNAIENLKEMDFYTYFIKRKKDLSD